MIIKIVVSTNRKWNVLSKLISPKVLLSVRYITSELEEMEREDNFRLKRFKELKTKKNKGDDNANHRCYCDKKPGKGDDFVCTVCKKEEEKRNKPKKVINNIKFKSHVSDVIGDKPSSLSTANQKRLDELTEHLEIVISLTNQCKTEGLMSPSADSFLYACKEVICKLEEIDQPQNSCNTSGIQALQEVCCELREEDKQGRTNQNSCNVDDVKADQDICCNINEDEKPEDITCNVCNENNVVKAKDIPCKVNAENNQGSGKENDLLGCFETKFKEIVKVIKTQNCDGTISEEKQVITIKTERKHPHKPNQLCCTPCCKIDSFDSRSGLNGKSDKNDDICCKRLETTKSEDISRYETQQSELRVCVSDTKYDKKNVNKTLNLNCTVCDTGTEPQTSPVCYNKESPTESEGSGSNVFETSSKNICCNRECPSKTGSSISKLSKKSSQNICCNTKCPSQTENSKSKLSKKSSQNICCNTKCPSQTGSSKSELSKKSYQSVCCNTKCPSQTRSSKSKISEKSSKNVCCIIKCPSQIGKSKSKESEKCKKKSDKKCNSHICCNKECPSETGSNKSRVSQKSSKKCCKICSKTSKKDESCTCSVPTKSTSCDPVWRDESCSTTYLVEVTEETEKESICIEDSDSNEPENKTLCCDKKSDKVIKKKSSLIFSLKMCKSKDHLKNTENCATCNAESKIKPSSGECPYCISNSKINPKSDNCECKETQGNYSIQCPECASEHDSKQNSEKCPKCDAIIEIKKSCEKCLHCGAIKETKPSPRKCPHCAAKQETKASSGKCPHCVTKQEHKPTLEKCPHCASKEESKPSSDKCPQCDANQETKSSSEKRSHSAAKKENKTNSEKCLKCAGKQETKPDADKCTECDGSNETKDNQDKCCKIRIISKQNKGGKTETVQEFVFLGNILEAIQQILVPGAEVNDKNKASDMQESDARKSCSLCSTLNESLVCGKNDEKPITGARQRSQSLGNMSCKQNEAVRYNSGFGRNASETNSCPSCIEESEPYCAVCESLASAMTEDTCQICSSQSKHNVQKRPKNKEQDKETKCPRTFLKNSQSCPVCDDKKSANVRQIRSEESCCSTPKVKLCCDQVTKRDASTSTRRSDRYDVRPLKVMKPPTRLTCPCQSDSILLQSTRNRPPDPKRCRSCMCCHTDYNDYCA